MKSGSGETETFKCVEKLPPQKHIFTGRVSMQHDIETVHNYCNEKQMGLLYINKRSSEESNAFQCVFQMKDIDLEDPSLWPQNVVIGRYRLNDSSRERLKTLPKNLESKVKPEFLKCLVYNARLVRNKTVEINSAILSSQSHVITFAESWIQTNENNYFLIKEYLNESYIPWTFSREFSTGYGVLHIERIFLFLLFKIYATKTSKLLLVEYFP